MSKCQTDSLFAKMEMDSRPFGYFDLTQYKFAQGRLCAGMKWHGLQARENTARMAVPLGFD